MKDLLKFITCGSVDDGKSTLIGHMLYDAKLLFTDQEQSLDLESKVGSREGKLDYSLLLDGLMAEREQGITIDVSYRFFSTEKRSFIVADCPGHEQYTRNMAVGASFADLAIILVNAKNGITLQTKRHIRICSLMGIRHFVLTINKMDLVDYEEKYFRTISQEFYNYLKGFSIDSVHIIPVSATEGDNITNYSNNIPYYSGAPLLSYLESIDIKKKQENNIFFMPVQRVSRPNHKFRGFQGQIESGILKIGDSIKVLPNKENALVTNIYTGWDELGQDEAVVGQPVTITLDREIDVSRGDVITNGKLCVSDSFSASILWMDDKALYPGRGYLLKCGTKMINAEIDSVENKLDIDSGEMVSAKLLNKNDIGTCNISLSQDTVFTPFKENKHLGSFIIIDRVTYATAGAGVIYKPLEKSKNITWQEMQIDRKRRSMQLGQKPFTIWFTGLSGSGKSTIADALERQLVSLNKHTMLLDGDNIRHGLNHDLEFSEEDRIENIRRISEVSKLMNDAGLITIVSFISPFKSDRNKARQIIGHESFVEIYVSTPLEECEKRDIKGLYKKARDGKILNFTGISSPYEEPENPLCKLDTSKISIKESVDLILDKIKKNLY